MTQPARRVELPERAEFWRWVWSAVRPVLGWVLAAAGAITLLVGWFGVSGESLTAKQLPYVVSAGLAGIALFIMAGVFLATDDVRRQFDRIGELERKVDDLYALFVAAVPVVIVAGLLGARFLRAARATGHDELVGPLVAYMAVIAAMVTCALASGNALAALGAVLFMASDALIAETRFGDSQLHRWAPVVIMVTYHLGQAGLTLSLVHG